MTLLRCTILASLLLAATTVSRAHADESHAAYDLRVGSNELGSVRSVASTGGDPDKSVTLATSDLSPALVSELRAFYEGKTTQKSLSLSSGAVVKRASEARLASVKLPAVGAGAGAAPEVELAFDVGSMRTSPSYATPKQHPTSVPKISGFHLRVSDLAAKVNRVDAITVKQIVGSTTLPPVTFTIDSADAPQFQAWAKSKTARRDTSIEYTDDRGEALLKVTLQGCLPAVTPNGPVTNVVVTCARIKAT